MKLWCVRVAYHYGDETYSDTLSMDTALCGDKESAIKILEDRIRYDWGWEVSTQDGMKCLADCRGMSEDEESVKYSSWHYSEDGMRAWYFRENGNGQMGEVCQIEDPDVKRECEGKNGVEM